MSDQRGFREWERLTRVDSAPQEDTAASSMRAPSGRLSPPTRREHMQADGRIGDTDCLGLIHAPHCRAERNGNCSFCSFGGDVKTNESGRSALLGKKAV